MASARRIPERPAIFPAQRSANRRASAATPARSLLERLVVRRPVEIVEVPDRERFAGRCAVSGPAVRVPAFRVPGRICHRSSVCTLLRRMREHWRRQRAAVRRHDIPGTRRRSAARLRRWSFSELNPRSRTLASISAQVSFTSPGCMGFISRVALRPQACSIARMKSIRCFRPVVAQIVEPMRRFSAVFRRPFLRSRASGPAPPACRRRYRR